MSKKLCKLLILSVCLSQIAVTTANACPDGLESCSVLCQPSANAPDSTACCNSMDSTSTSGDSSCGDYYSRPTP